MAPLFPPIREGVARLGILGGTFDPPHFGHLLMADTARLEMNLDEVVFVPAGLPPHKRKEGEVPRANGGQRMEMVRLAIADNPFFQAWDFELKKNGPDYTIETLRYLRKNLPGLHLFFIMGRDSLEDIFSWKNPTEILTEYDIIVVSREGDPHSAINEIKEKEKNARLHPVVMPAVNISSSELRKRIREKGRIAYLTPPSVESYIFKNNLYF